MTIEEELILHFKARANTTAVTEETGLITSGLVDSFGIVELVSHIEEVYGIQFTNEDMDVASFQNIRKVADLIRRKTT